MRRFHLRKGVAISLGLAFVALLYLILSVGLFESHFKMRERLPLYEEISQVCIICFLDFPWNPVLCLVVRELLQP